MITLSKENLRTIIAGGRNPQTGKEITIPAKKTTK